MRSSRKFGVPGPVLALGAAFMVVVACIGGLTGCSPPTVDIISPPEGFSDDPSVKALVAEKLARVEAAPTSARAHGELALAYQANKLWSLAQLAFHSAATLEPDDPGWRLHEAVCLRMAGDVDGSLALLREVVQENPGLAAAQERLGQSALTAGDLVTAEGAFRRVIALAGDSPEGHLGLAEVQLANGAFEPAHAAATVATKKAPQNKAAHYALGQALQGLGQFDDAERELSLGVGAAPTWISLPYAAELRRLGVSYAHKFERAGDALDAGVPLTGVSILEGLLRERPDDINVLNNLGIAFTILGQHEKSEEVLRRAVSLDDERFESHLNLAHSLLDLLKLKEALVHADRAVELAPEVGRTHFMRAQVLSYQENFPMAYAALRRSVKLDARDPMVHVALGEISMRLGVWAEARGHFEHAIERRPDFLPAHINLAKCLVETGALAEADERLIVLEAQVPDDPRVQALRQSVPRRQR